MSVGSWAGYAVGDDASRGRRVEERGVDGGCPFAVDRGRIVACSAFRRLQNKTQVFAFDEHDHFRTRLTHTLEVAMIARRLAVGLRVNESLVEAIALAHDLGHPPFGHAGEGKLAELMAEHGGFEHNAQTLRVVDHLEHPYPPFRGLNLTFEVREGIVKHVSRYDEPRAEDWAGDSGVAGLFDVGPSPTVEAQVVSVADRIAYDAHDIEDALGAGLLDGDDLAEVSLWDEASCDCREQYGDGSVHALRRPILDRIVHRLVDDCVGTSGVLLSDVTDVQMVRERMTAVVGFSEDVSRRVEELEEFLARKSYGHERVAAMDRRARFCIEDVFRAHVSDIHRLPNRFAARVDAQGVYRVVCDYVAGMTDRYCLECQRTARD